MEIKYKLPFECCLWSFRICNGLSLRFSHEWCSGSKVYPSLSRKTWESIFWLYLCLRLDLGYCDDHWPQVNCSVLVRWEWFENIMKYCKLKRKFWKVLGVIKTPALETLKLLSRFLKENKIGVYPVANNPKKWVCESLGTFLPHVACPMLFGFLVFMVISEVLRIESASCSSGRNHSAWASVIWPILWSFYLGLACPELQMKVVHAIQAKSRLFIQVKSAPVQIVGREDSFEVVAYLLWCSETVSLCSWPWT